MEKVKTATDLRISFTELSRNVKALSEYFEQPNAWSDMIYEKWNAKDVLGHLVFWHESFARNISDLGHGLKPQPLKGKLSEVNERSVAENKEVPIQILIARLHAAHNTIAAHIFDISIDLIPYKKGSRDYSRLEHVEIVNNHIRRHLNDLKKHFKDS